MNAPTKEQSSSRSFGSPALDRRTLLGIGGAVGLAALAGCSAAATAGTPTGSTAGTSSSSSSGNTQLSAGTYTATFSSSGGGDGPGGGGGGSQQLSGAYLVNGISATIDGGTWASTTADQNVFLVVNGGSLTITNATITKSGDSSNEDACNFYGLNSAILVVDDGSSASLTDCTITTDADGANAVFAAASGAITIDGITIRTSKDSSRGLDATYTGTVTAKDVDITTAGAHCACLATDRGNGTITVTGESRLASSGDGSPLVYSTGDISVAGATGTATGAQTMVIEGKNKISVDGCTFDTSGTTGMMVYQSFSGDAADSDATAEKASLVIKDSSVTSTTAKPMIYVTNTTCQIEVTSSKLTHPASTPLLSLAEDRWGTSGSNGGHAAVTFTDCTVKGALEADASSSATVTLKSGHLTGGTSGDVEVTKDTSSTWSH
jgi:hypothetical protein